MANYSIVNQIANPGFESGWTNWSSNNSYVDPEWTGDEDDFEPLFGEGPTTSPKYAGTHAYQFGLDYDLGNAYVHSEVHQTLASPLGSDAVYAASFYAWSPASNWSPTEVDVTISYSDASPSYYSQDITGSTYYMGSSDWHLVNFKSALRPGKTITKITISTESYPYDHENLWIDNVTLSKKIPLFFPTHP
jgi:hypothetical protein